MQLHANAALSLNARRRMVAMVMKESSTIAEAAEQFAVSAKTCRKWCRRFLADGELGLLDRSSAPTRSPHQTPAERVEAIAALRRLRFTGPEIAETLNMALSTVSQILLGIGMGKLGRIGLEPAQRYEWQRPGELIHIDIKKLGRIQGGAGKRITGARNHYNTTFTDRDGKRRNTVGWDYVHVAIDCTRLAYAEVLADEKAVTVIGFLRRVVAFYARHGIVVERLLTDNGGAYRSTVHAVACKTMGIRHLRTRPYRPQTNGKAERLIRTMLGGWAYGAIYRSSQQRTAALDGWLWHYNHRRRHSALGHQPPIARLNKRNNLHGTYTPIPRIRCTSPTRRTLDFDVPAAGATRRRLKWHHPRRTRLN
jgi:transposase InsO family protein/transposase-like protein